MSDQPPLNPDALRVATTAAHDAVDWQMYDVTKFDLEDSVDVATIAAVSAYLAVAQPEVTSVEAFINQRPEYITALKNTRGTDDQSDYWRWQGHAESRRQLAQALGWTVPHNPGETTSPGGEAMTIQEILEAHKSYRTYIDRDDMAKVSCSCGDRDIKRAGMLADSSHRAHVAEVLDKHMQERIDEAVIQELESR